MHNVQIQGYKTIYHIVGNIRGRKFHGSVGSEQFVDKTFAEC